MKRSLMFLVFGFWFLLAVRDIIWIVFIALILSMYYWLRFHKKGILLLWFGFITLSLFLVRPIRVDPHPGEYRIIQIKRNYAIAQSKNVKILVYGLSQPNFDEVIRVDKLELIEERRNLYQFSFVDYCKKENITHYSNIEDAQVIQSPPTLKSRIFSVFRNNPILKANLYGIQSEKEDLIVQLGLPIIGLHSLLYGLLRRWFSEDAVMIFLFLLWSLYGFCFVYTIALIRFLLFQLGRYFFETWQTRISFSMTLFLILCPAHALDFTFVFPTLYRLSFYFIVAEKRWLFQKGLLFVCQCLYFHEVDILLFCFFSLFRRLQSIAFIFSFFGFGFSSFAQWIGRCTFYYRPGIVFGACIILFLFFRKKSLIFLLCLLPFVEHRIDPFFHVYMLDIGQGDCTLIVEPFQKSAVMIDCGQSMYRDNVEQIILPFLQSLHISHLDALICTHDDFDHAGGKNSLAQAIKIDEIITDRSTQLKVDYPFYSLLESRNAKDENDESIINYFSYDGQNYLWTGDASSEIEEILVDSYHLDVDVLKLGHHGSDTSSSFSFLDTLRPKIALISVGSNNRYGHPSSRVIADCHTLGINTLSTARQGMIHIYSWRNFVGLETGNHLFAQIQ